MERRRRQGYEWPQQSGDRGQWKDQRQSRRPRGELVSEQTYTDSQRRADAADAGGGQRTLRVLRDDSDGQERRGRRESHAPPWHRWRVAVFGQKRRKQQKE